MNWQGGLQRISAVFWSFWWAVGVMYSIALASDYARDNGWAYGVGAAAGFVLALGGVLYCLHRVACWVLAGFFKP